MAKPILTRARKNVLRALYLYGPEAVFSVLETVWRKNKWDERATPQLDLVYYCVTSLTGVSECKQQLRDMRKLKWVKGRYEPYHYWDDQINFKGFKWYWTITEEGLNVLYQNGGI